MKVVCANCSKVFEKKIAEINRTKFNCCSKKCTGEYKQAQNVLSFPLSFTEDVETGCWVWIKRLNRHGYGVKRYEKKAQLAHRVSYKIYVGEIPEGKQVLHKCDNPACVNPEHLWIGTHQDNMMDMIEKGRADFQQEKQPIPSPPTRETP